jgi:hypothetical protein
MSLTKFNEIRCNCDETLNPELISSVNAVQNPELKESILAGEFNLVRCDSCFEYFHADVFVLYIDIPQEIIAFIHPASEEKNRVALEEKMMLDFTAVAGGMKNGKDIGFEPMIFFGMGSFADFLRSEADLQDEVDVFEYVCREKEILTARISRSAARKSNIPAVLPKKSGPGSRDALREEIIEGLREIVTAAPELSSYRKALQVILDDPCLKF